MGYWDTVVATIKFLVHFIVVICMLFIGAFVFAAIEDPPIDDDDVKLSNQYLRILQKDVPLSDYNPDNYTNSKDAFWAQIKYKYELKIPGGSQDKIMDDMRHFIDHEQRKYELMAHHKKMRDRAYVIMKWFYFLTIASTTIGYGDISPKTEDGKLFYMIFSIIGIGLMMTLLGRCGTVVTAANQKFFCFIKQRFCSDAGVISEEMLSVVSIILCFFIFLLVGYWHRGTIKDTDCSIINFTYYWIVTFTTVGFGDLYLYTLEEEITNIYILLVYRIFGLSFVSGIIASLEDYVAMKQKELQEKTRVLTETRKAILDRTLSVTSDSTTYPKFAIDRKLNTLERQKLKRYPEDYVDDDAV